MAVDRGCYIDQSQSLNVHMEQPNFGKLTSLHFHAWSKVLLRLCESIFLNSMQPIFILYLSCHEKELLSLDCVFARSTSKHGFILVDLGPENWDVLSTNTSSC